MGVPDLSRLEDDGDSRNIDLPYSKVNHLKVTTHQQYAWEKFILSGDTVIRTITARNGVRFIPITEHNLCRKLILTKNWPLI